MHFHHFAFLTLIDPTHVSALPSASQFVSDWTPSWSIENAWQSALNKASAFFGPVTVVEAEQESHVSRHRTPIPQIMLTQYGGDVVLRFNISTSEQVESFREAVDTLLLDVWTFSGDYIDVRLAEDLVPSLLALLPASLQHAHVPLLREMNLARAVWDTFPDQDSSRHTPVMTSPLPHRQFSPALGRPRSSSADSNIFFSDYQPLSVITPWMQLLSSLFTTHTRLITIGKTSEGRDILAFRIGVHPTNRQAVGSKRQSILISAGLHAREWISTSTANYIAYGLITGYGKSAPITELLEAFDFIIIPTINPDGYAYTWETDRLWRKNRQQTSLRFCPGLDLDHSFGFEWDGDATAGNACSESYAGEQPFQAVEAQHLAEWAKNETDNNNVEFISFIDLHSYSEQILYPYTYSCNASPPGLEDLEELAYGLEKAIRVSHGHEYEVMSACEGNTAITGSGKKVLPWLESPGGSALDYFYHELHARWSYQIKLRDRGTYGFLLPREHIVPTGKEILDAMLYLGSFLTEVYGATNVSGNHVTMTKGAAEDDTHVDLKR